MSQLSPRDRFILKIGILGYGGSVFVIFNLLHVWRLHVRGASFEGEPLMLLATAIASPLLGWAFGLIAWNRLTRRSGKR